MSATVDRDQLAAPLRSWSGDGARATILYQSSKGGRMRRSGRLVPRVDLAVLAVILVIILAWLISPTAALVTAGVAVFAVLLAVSILVLPAKLVARDADLTELNAEKRASAINSVRSTFVQGLIGLAALAGIVVAWWQLQSDREQSRTDRNKLTEQLELTRQGQVAERFTRAVELLGSDKLEQRLGGIYALERIAEESNSTRLQVFEVLTAYVRHPPPQVEKANRSTDVGPLSTRATDVQAVMTVLGRRTVMAADPPLDLRLTDLRKAYLSGTNFQKAILIVAQLQEADLTDAQLQKAALVGAQLQKAALVGAQLQRANLREAQLQRAILTRAQLQKADLTDAQLQKAALVGVQLQGADLTGAQLQGVYLVGAQLQEADLTDAQLQGATADDTTVWPNGFDPRAAGVRRGS